jgi:hypothetical protein
MQVHSVRLKKEEDKVLKDSARRYGLTVSDYIRTKLFDHNMDLLNDPYQYYSPYTAKHNVITVSCLSRIISLLTQVLKKSGASAEELIEAEQIASNFAENMREKYGYKKVEVTKDEQ